MKLTDYWKDQINLNTEVQFIIRNYLFPISMNTYNETFANYNQDIFTPMYSVKDSFFFGTDDQLIGKAPSENYINVFSPNKLTRGCSNSEKIPIQEAEAVPPSFSI